MKLSWRLLNNLAKAFGPSFYLLDAAAFERNFADLLDAFRRQYPRASLAYSYKTNYLPQLCRRANELGGYAEVVSGMEYELALRVGVPPRKIIFNGPYKTAGEIERALRGGALVNLDNAAEVPLVQAAARRAPNRPLRVGLRCNFDFGAGGISRFGIDAAGGALAEIISRLRRIKRCRVDGLHCHFMTADRSAAAYAAAAGEMLKLARALFGSRPPGILDLGGGFCSRMRPELAAQFDFKIPTFEEYARAIAGPFARAFPGKDGPRLIIEPGMALAADALLFAARAVSLKIIRSRTCALLSGSVYELKPTKNAKNPPLQHFPKPGRAHTRRPAGPVDLVGYTCMEDDCLYRNYRGAPAVNDYFVFHNVGAYTIVLKPPFILPAPPILAESASAPGKYEAVRRQESFEDVFAAYLFAPGGQRHKGARDQRSRGSERREEVIRL